MQSMTYLSSQTAKSTYGSACTSSRRLSGLVFKKIPLRLASGKTVYFFEFKLD